MHALRILAAESPEVVASRWCKIFEEPATKTLGNNKQFDMALSRGSIPRSMHAMMGEDGGRRRISRGRIGFFPVDGCCVPLSHLDSKGGAALRDFIQRLPVLSEKVHRVRGEGLLEEAAAKHPEETACCFRLRSGASLVFDAGNSEDPDRKTPATRRFSPKNHESSLGTRSRRDNRHRRTEVPEASRPGVHFPVILNPVFLCSGHFTGRVRARRARAW